MTEPRWRRYLRFFRRNPIADVDDELQFHFEQRVEEYRAAGMSRDDAIAAARRQFGDVDRTRTDLVSIDTRMARVRDGALWWDAIRADLRTSVRSLVRQPAFSAAVIVTLALGLGVNAAMFSFLDRVYLRMPEGVVDPESIRRMWIFERDERGRASTSELSTGGKELEAMRAALRDDAELAPFVRQRVVRFDDDSKNDRTLVRVAANYFSLLGIKPAIGRFFTEKEADPGAPEPIAVISHSLWQSRYGGRVDVLGKTLALNGRKHTIVGVTQPGFAGVDVDRSDVWIPLSNNGPGFFGIRPAGPPRYFNILVRRRPNANEERIASVATTLVRATNAQFPRLDVQATTQTGSLIRARGPGTQQKEIVLASRLGGVAIIVLIVAGANVVNLLLARAVARRREIAVRVALGISRARLFWLLVIPTVLLALCAGIVATASAQVSGRLLRATLTPTMHFDGAPVHWRVVVFTMLASLVAGVIAAIIPAIQSTRPDVTSFLKSGVQSGVVQRSRLRDALLTVQAALSVVLLVGAGLFLRSVWNVEGIRLGVDVPRITRATALYDDWRPKDSVAVARVAERLSRTRGIESVAITTMGLMSGVLMGPYFTETDSVVGDYDLSTVAAFSGVSETYFAVVGTRILRGTGFERATGPSVVVNELFAKKFWPQGNALGQCVWFGKRASPCYTVVGVSENAHSRGVMENTGAHFYFLLRHPPFKGMRGGTLLIRGRADDAAGVERVTRQVLLEEFPGARPDIESLERVLEPAYRPFRLGARMFGAFGLLALIVAVVGIYSSVSYAVAQRTHEFGVRIALGAGLSDVVDSVLRRSLLPVAVGLVIGIVLAMLGGRFIASLLFGVVPSDVSVIIGVATVLIGTATVASLVPARRAASVDPMIALRSE